MILSNRFKPPLAEIEPFSAPDASVVVSLHPDDPSAHTEGIHHPQKGSGGYPAYIQPGGCSEDYDFAFQISSDEKALFNFVDNGRIYFFYNKETHDWKVYYDFY